MSSILLANFLSFPRSLSTSHYQVSYPMMLFFSFQKFFFLATSSYVIIQFYIPFLSVFLRVDCPVNYAPKHRLPLFALSLSSPAATLYFFVRFNYESPLFTSLNEFYRIEFYSLAFLTRCPFSSSKLSTSVSTNLVSFRTVRESPSFVQLLSLLPSSRCNRYVRLSATLDTAALDERAATKTNGRKRLYCLFENSAEASGNSFSRLLRGKTGIFIMDIFSMRLISFSYFSAGSRMPDFLSTCYVDGISSSVHFPCSSP